MNEEAINKAGDEPVRPGIRRIRAITDKNELSSEVARLHDQGVDVFFHFPAQPDPADSKMNIAYADQGGLGTPDKSYYLQAKDEETRQKYVAHVSQILQLTGDPQAEADRDAKAIMALETALAKVSLGRVDRRNPHLTHHEMPLTGFQAISPISISRNKRCVENRDRSLGEALGQKYVEEAFAGQSKEKTQQLVNVIEQEMEADIKSLIWMSPATKE